MGESCKLPKPSKYERSGGGWQLAAGRRSLAIIKAEMAEERARNRRACRRCATLAAAEAIDSGPLTVDRGEGDG